MAKLKRSNKKTNWRHRPWLTTYLWIAAIEGFIISLSLFTLPADPENRIFLNLTRPRLVVFLVLFILTLLVLGLAIKSTRESSWAQKWSDALMGNQMVVPYITIGLLVVFMLGAAVSILFLTDYFVKLNPASITRLSPPILWLGLLLAQLWLVWGWVWKRHSAKLPRWAWDALAIGVLFIIGLWPRLDMTAYALPYQSVWDEVVTYTPAMKMLTTSGMKPFATVPGYGQAAYGDLVTYIAAGGELLGLLDGLRSGVVTSPQEYVSPPEGVKSIASAVNVSGLPLQVPRMLFAFLNSLAPVGIYLALRKGLGVDHGSAFAGGFIFALLSRDVIYYSSYILPDALTATLIIFLLIAAWKAISEKADHLWTFLVTGILAGMMVSLTIRVVLVVLVPVLAVLLASNKQRFAAKLGLSLAGIAVGFIIFSPYALLDLPSYLAKVTGLTWSYDLSLANRLAGLAYYLKGMFMPGFNSLYVDSSQGSVGLGLVAGFLAILGVGKALLRFPRQTILTLVIVVLHLYLISPLTQRYTRHALVLYPIVCIFAGVGLSWIVEGVQWLDTRLSSKTHRTTNPGFRAAVVPALVLIVFILVSIPQLNLTLRYVYRMHNYQAPQVQAAEYLSSQMTPGDKVGILDVLPWVEDDLLSRHISYERIPASFTIKDLKAHNITLVAGTDRFGADYSSLTGTIWQTAFTDTRLKLAEYGVGALLYDGYPAGQLYLFIARLP